MRQTPEFPFIQRAIMVIIQRAKRFNNPLDDLARPPRRKPIMSMVRESPQAGSCFLHSFGEAPAHFWYKSVQKTIPHHDLRKRDILGQKFIAQTKVVKNQENRKGGDTSPNDYENTPSPSGFVLRGTNICICSAIP